MVTSMNELDNDFLIKRNNNNTIYGIQSLNCDPIDCDILLNLSKVIKKNCHTIRELSLHICVDRGYLHDIDILNEIIINCDKLFDGIISCININIFEFDILQVPHNVIKKYFDMIIMNKNIIFNNLSFLSININEYLLIFLNEYDNNNNINNKYLNPYQSFLCRHNKLNLNNISIQVHLSPNIVILSMDHDNDNLNSIQNLQEILSIFIWRLFGALYLSEIQLKSFYFWCRYNVEISKLIPLIESIINVNCNKNLISFDLNLSHLTSKYIDKILKCLINNCNKLKLNKFVLNSLDTDSFNNDINKSLKNEFLTLSNSANKTLINFLLYFNYLENIYLNIAQFQLYQFNQLIKTITNLLNIRKLYFGDSILPNISSCFDLYDDINIWQNFTKIIDKNGYNLDLISINIQKLDCIQQFLIKNTILIDSIFKLYFNINYKINIIMSFSTIYPKQILLIIIQFLFNYNNDFIISFSGSPKLLQSKLNILKYIKQFYSNFIFKNTNYTFYINKDIINDIPKKNILMTINGSVIINTKLQQDIDNNNNNNNNIDFPLPPLKYDQSV